MSNLIFKQNSKNQIGVGTNKIELTNSLSSALNIKKNDDSYSFLEFNTSSNTISVGTDMAANDVIIFKGTTKITTLSKGSLVYLDSSGNWTGIGTVGIGSYIQVNSGGTGLQWTGIKPSIALTTKSPSHNSTMSANSDNIILTFDEPIIAGTGNIVLTPSSGSAITIDVTNTSLVSFSSNVCTINPSSNLDATGLTYTVTMASGVIKNSNGDLFNGISGTSYQFNSKDTTSATVSNVTSSTSNGSYKTDDSISIQVVFTETVIVTGTPQLTLETGTNDAVVNYASGSGSNTLTFTYTISSGHTSSDLDYKATSSLSLNGGTIKDAGGNSATLTLPSPGATGSLGANKAIVVDTTAPSVVSFTISDTSLKVGETATVTLQFSESVSGFNSDADITEQNGSLATMTSSDNITWTGTFTPTIDIEDTTNIIQLATSYTDSAGNSGPTAQTANYSIDTTIPTMTITSSTSGVSSGSTSSGTPVSLIFTSNKSTTNFSISDITVSNGSLNSFSGSGTTYTATFTPTASGTCTITVNAGTYTDTAGNNNTAGSLSWTFVAPVNGNTPVDWTLVNTSSANPTSSSSSYGDPNYNDGATWIIGGYQGSGLSTWQGDWLYNTSHTTENIKSFNLFEHTSNANSVTSGYYTLSRVYERTGLDHYSGGSTNDPSHGLKVKFNTTVGGDSNTAGHPQTSWAGNGDPWGMLVKMGYETPSTGTYVKAFATRGGISSSAPSKIIMDFNKYIALTSFEWPSYQWYGYHRHTRLYYWNESLSTPAWTEIIHFYSAFSAHGSVFLRKNNTGSDHGATKNYTNPSGGTNYNNGANISGGYSGSFNQNVPREPLIRLRFPTSLSATAAPPSPLPHGDDNRTGHVKSFVRQAYYARYYKIEQYGTNSASAGMAYYAKMKGIIPNQTALF